MINCPACNTVIPKNMKTCPGCFSVIVKRTVEPPPVDEKTLLKEALEGLMPEDRKKVLSTRDRLVAEARDIDELGLLALGLASIVLSDELGS